MEETEKLILTPRDIMVRFGLICGGVGILTVVILYALDAKLLFGYYAYIGFGAAFAVAVFSSEYRKRNSGGYITYGDAVVTSLVSFSIGEVIYTLFMLLLYFVIDPHLIDKMKTVQLDKMDQLLATGVINKVQYTAAQTSIENINGNSILFYSLMGVIVIIIISLLIFLLSSIFIKNEKAPV